MVLCVFIYCVTNTRDVVRLEKSLTKVFLAFRKSHKITSVLDITVYKHKKKRIMFLL